MSTTKPTMEMALPYGVKDRAAMLAEALRRQDDTSLLAMFHEIAAAGGLDKDMPVDPAKDTVLFGIATRFGHADVVVEHADGAATVVMIRNGDRGWQHVCEGIGLLGLQALEIGLRPATKHRVRRVLAFSIVGSVEDGYTNAAIGAVCDRAGVVPMHLPPYRACLGVLSVESTLAQLNSVSGAIERVLAGRKNQEQPA